MPFEHHSTLRDYSGAEQTGNGFVILAQNLEPFVDGQSTFSTWYETAHGSHRIERPCLDRQRVGGRSRLAFFGRKRGISRADGLNQCRRIGAHFPRQRLYRGRLVEYIAPASLVVGNIGVGDPRSRRHEVRELRVFFCQALVKHDIGVLLGLFDQFEFRVIELVAEALPPLVDQNGAMLEKAGLRFENRGQKAHDKGAQQPSRHILQRELHEPGQNSPRRQHVHQRP